MPAYSPCQLTEKSRDCWHRNPVVIRIQAGISVSRGRQSRILDGRQGGKENGPTEVLMELPLVTR